MFWLGSQRRCPALLEREDGTLVAWYPFLYAPRTGGAYDSHHRTAGVAGRTRRRGDGVAVCGASAAVTAAAHRRARVDERGCAGFRQGIERRTSRAWLRRRTEFCPRGPFRGGKR